MSTDAFWNLLVWAHKNKEYLSVTIDHKYSKEVKLFHFQDKDKYFSVKIAVGLNVYKRIRESDKSEDHAIWDEVEARATEATLHLVGGKR